MLTTALPECLITFRGREADSQQSTQLLDLMSVFGSDRVSLFGVSSAKFPIVCAMERHDTEDLTVF